MNRRQFVAAGAALLAASRSFGQAPAVQKGKAAKAVVIASSNGNRFKNGGDRTCVEKAFAMMMDGADVLDAVIAGVNINELDPLDDSVGYGGLPNADGIVQLDSCCMHGPRKRAGGVASLEGVRTPSLVAKAVMEQTDHHLIVGEGARRFARNIGFRIEDDLNTENSRRKWLEWKRQTDPAHYLDPANRPTGTINCDGVNANGDVCGVTTTSGLAWKIPGRAGDSPILGAGLYVDGEIGAAGSTGRGEANLYNLSSFLIVENMRRGMHPKDAGLDALRRIRANTVEKRLLNSRGLPNFGLNFYIVNKKGEYAGVSMYPSRYAVCTEAGAQTLATEALFEGRASD
jgi:N4-(beta-N-acetylglucosaminyl)-L-asparaginase